MAGPEPRGEPISSGYQGVVYKIRVDTLWPGGSLPDGQPAPESNYLIVKEAMGIPVIRDLRRRMIRREYEIYRRLEGVAGIPRCYGLIDDRLLLEFVAGHSLRLSTNELPDRDAFFATLLETLLAAHRAGVAHADMKRKENILVTPDGKPFLIDFGSAVIRNEERPLSRWLFEQACQIDLNAWVKHKYLARYDLISPADEEYFRPTAIERWTGPVRRAWRRLTVRNWREQRRGAKADRQSHR
jgi:predicted Ser/Thr protein kinase